MSLVRKFSLSQYLLHGGLRTPERCWIAGYEVLENFQDGKMATFNMMYSPKKTNIALQKMLVRRRSFPFKMVPFQGTFVHFRGGGGNFLSSTPLETNMGTKYPYS